LIALGEKLVNRRPKPAPPHPTKAKGTTMSESIIRADAPVVTLINVFTVDPVDQQRLVELWQRATDDVMRHLPGFVSANVHRSLDGTKVVNYAQWESQEAFTAMLQNPDARPYLTELSEIGTPAPVLCEVVSVHHI
jgi:quinol monooxygenase YgiN